MATSPPTRDYQTIPGTYVFDGERCREGYALNMFCMSLAQESNRQEMRANEAAYLDQWDLTPEQRESIEQRQWLRMLQLGGNVYYTFKLAALDGMTFRHLAAGMTGVPIEEFAEMMMSGGRSIDGNQTTEGTVGERTASERTVGKPEGAAHG